MISVPTSPLHLPSPAQYRASQLPLWSLTSGQQLQTWFDFLQQQGLNSWALLPIHGPSQQPYRGSGFGVLLDPQLATDLRQISAPATIDFWQTKLAATEKFYLDQAALFAALSDYFGSEYWPEWPLAIARHQSTAITMYRRQLADKIAGHRQQLLANLVDFRLLQQAAAASGLHLIGDLPFYLGLETFSVWQYQAGFLLDENLTPSLVSGVPDHPDEPFWRQVWGHPLYDWQSTNLRLLGQLFNRRLAQLKNLGFSLVRVDHAQGFYRHGALDPTSTTSDQILPGPGPAFLTRLIDRARQLRLKLFFEDLAPQAQPLQRLMRQQGIPGVKTLTLAFNSLEQTWDDQTAALPDLNRHQFFYTSSHDTLPLLGWLEQLKPVQRRHLAQLNQLPLTLAADPPSLAVHLRQLALSQTAPPAIIVPVADFLLQTQPLNRPGTPDHQNWLYPFPLELKH